VAVDRKYPNLAPCIYHVRDLKECNQTVGGFCSDHEGTRSRSQPSLLAMVDENEEEIPAQKENGVVLHAQIGKFRRLVDYCVRSYLAFLCSLEGWHRALLG
jgi:hypothetical protein